MNAYIKTTYRKKTDKRIKNKKSHFFIGRKINSEVIPELKRMQNFIRGKKFKLSDPVPRNYENGEKFNFVLKYIYLGYLDEDVLNY
jgi:hypothetical protein